MAELEETTIKVPLCSEPHFKKFTEENLERFYRAKFKRKCECELEEGECCCHKRRGHEKFEFLEIDLDLRGNIATESYFLHKRPCGRAKHKWVLYMNNAGRMILTRNFCETKFWGDFD